MSPTPHSWRPLRLTLALLALLVKVAVPAGFMAAPSTAALPFAVVICTGDGPLDLAAHESPPDRGGKPAPSAPHDSPCAFAGHGAHAPAPQLAHFTTITFVAWAAPAVPQAPDLAPGRGLAAPPLPARGPPRLLI